MTLANVSGPLASASGPLAKASWPLARLGEGLLALAQAGGLQPAAEAALGAPDAGELSRWVAWAGPQAGLLTEPVCCTVPDAQAMLERAGPALLAFHDGEALHCLLLLGGRRGRLRLLAPDGSVLTLPLEAVRDGLCARHEQPLAPEIDRLLQDAGLPLERRAAARRALLAERLADRWLHGCWLLRTSPGAPMRRQLHEARLPRRVAGLLVITAVGYALEIAGWQIVGQAALDGRLDLGWLTAWALLLLTMVPLRSAGAWLAATFAQGVSTLLKRRLLAGALRARLDTLRVQGAGRLLAQVMEAQALEAQGLAGAMGLGIALIELGFAAWVLSLGAAPAWHLALLLAWLLLAAALAWRFHGRLRAWTLSRLALTHRLVEDMVGHRTRLAQQRPERRDAEEDALLAGYLGHARALDDATLPIAAAAPGGWLLLALAALAPVLGTAAATPAALAVSVGGLLMAHRALGGLSGGLAALARAAVAWEQVAPLFKAGAGREEAAPFAPSVQRESTSPVLVARQLAFRHRGAPAPVLHGVDLSIAPGDRLLLQGASGGGKSTLAALLTGLRHPDHGLLLLAGLDRPTLGAQWHRLATEAPQFHDNHVLAGTLAFNLLLGHTGPVDESTLADATALCEALGLGELLARMPAGLQQQVGETGWQLSHGEKSRLFLARALLQRAPLTVLDESFGALDPATLARCLQATLARTNALVVVAHP